MNLKQATELVYLVSLLHIETEGMTSMGSTRRPLSASTSLTNPQTTLTCAGNKNQAAKIYFPDFLLLQLFRVMGKKKSSSLPCVPLGSDGVSPSCPVFSTVSTGKQEKFAKMIFSFSFPPPPFHHKANDRVSNHLQQRRGSSCTTVPTSYLLQQL